MSIFRRPGVMIYEEIKEDIFEMTLEERGMLLDAIIEYAFDGVLPEFRDRAMRSAWRNTKKAIDLDGNKYDRARLRSEYGNYCKSRQKEKVTPLSYEDFILKFYPDSAEVDRLMLREPDGQRVIYANTPRASDFLLEDVGNQMEPSRNQPEPSRNQMEPNYQHTTTNYQYTTNNSQHTDTNSQQATITSKKQPQKDNGQRTTDNCSAPKTKMNISDPNDILRAVHEANAYKADYSQCKA